MASGSSADALKLGIITETDGWTSGIVRRPNRNAAFRCNGDDHLGAHR